MLATHILPRNIPQECSVANIADFRKSLGALFDSSNLIEALSRELPSLQKMLAISTLQEPVIDSIFSRLSAECAVDAKIFTPIAEVLFGTIQKLNICALAAASLTQRLNSFLILLGGTKRVAFAGVLVRILFPSTDSSKLLSKLIVSGDWSTLEKSALFNALSLKPRLLPFESLVDIWISYIQADAVRFDFYIRAFIELLLLASGSALNIRRVFLTFNSNDLSICDAESLNLFLAFLHNFFLADVSYQRAAAEYLAQRLEDASILTDVEFLLLVAAGIDAKLRSRFLARSSSCEEFKSFLRFGIESAHSLFPSFLPGWLQSASEFRVSWLFDLFFATGFYICKEAVMNSLISLLGEKGCEDSLNFACSCLLQLPSVGLREFLCHLRFSFENISAFSVTSVRKLFSITTKLFFPDWNSDPFAIETIIQLKKLLSSLSLHSQKIALIGVLSIACSSECDTPLLSQATCSQFDCSIVSPKEAIAKELLLLANEQAKKQPKLMGEFLLLLAEFWDQLPKSFVCVIEDEIFDAIRSRLIIDLHDDHPTCHVELFDLNEKGSPISVLFNDEFAEVMPCFLGLLAQSLRRKNQSLESLSDLLGCSVFVRSSGGKPDPSLLPYVYNWFRSLFAIFHDCTPLKEKCHQRLLQLFELRSFAQNQEDLKGSSPVSIAATPFIEQLFRFLPLVSTTSKETLPVINYKGATIPFVGMLSYLKEFADLSSTIDSLFFNLSFITGVPHSGASAEHFQLFIDFLAKFSPCICTSDFQSIELVDCLLKLLIEIFPSVDSTQIDPKQFLELQFLFNFSQTTPLYLCLLDLVFGAQGREFVSGCLVRCIEHTRAIEPAQLENYAFEIWARASGSELRLLENSLVVEKIQGANALSYANAFLRFHNLRIASGTPVDFDFVACTTRVFPAIVQHLKSLSLSDQLKSPLAVALVKRCVKYLDSYVRGCIPFLRDNFPRFPDTAIELLLQLQSGTRTLQQFCLFVKEAQHRPLLAVVPLLKKQLERILFAIKDVAGENGFVSAFWVGNLKSKNLTGDLIQTQIPIE